MLRISRLLAAAAATGIALGVPAARSADAAPPGLPDSPQIGIPFDPPCEEIDACGSGEPPEEEPGTPEEEPETPSTPDGEPDVGVHLLAATSAVAVPAAPNFTG